MLLLIMGAILGVVLVLGVLYVIDRKDFESGTVGEFAFLTIASGIVGMTAFGLIPSAFLDYDGYTTTSTTYEIKGTKEDTDYWQTHTKSGYRQHSSEVIKLYYKKYGTWRPHTIPFDEQYVKFVDSNEPPTITVHKHEKADTFYNNWIVLVGFKTKYTYTIKGALQ